MILNVSGRTDVVGFYMEWFINRYRDGFVDVRNPFNPKLVSRIYFSDVDVILFCTKNPIPLIKYINEFKEPIILHVTLTPYKNDIEPCVPSKSLVIDAIKKISNIIGKENVVLRYDPIFISDKYNISYHKKAFERICNLLDGYIDKIIVSFLDIYKNVRNNSSIIRYKNISKDDYKEIGVSFSNISKSYNMTVQTCFEKRNLSEYGFLVGECVSRDDMFKLTGKKFSSWKARKCKCAEMVDIGVYNSCNHLCKYCYANFDEKKVLSNMKLHDKNSSLLIGHLFEDDIIKIRKK